MSDSEWGNAAVRRLLVRALLAAASLFERLAEIEAKR